MKYTPAQGIASSDVEREKLQVRVYNMTVEMDELYKESKKMHECLVRVLNYLCSPEDQDAEFIERLVCEALKQYHIKP